MATLVLSSLGSLLGPVGQVFGTLAGNAIDNALFGPDDREGPRLKELAVSGSSYGSPIAALYGAMRVPGTVIWSTDLQEHSDKQSHGKGQPKTVTYSYSVSFAVALSSRPIERIGRIWADANLLRGKVGDLKSGGTLRIYRGLDDQQCDPLLEAALGDRCPAFRGCAYAVFEDLDLTDFGNRIPALSFEVIAGNGADLVESLFADRDTQVSADTVFPQLAGFSHDGGSLRNVVSVIDRIHPIAPAFEGRGLKLEGGTAASRASLALPEPALWEEGDFGRQSGSARARSDQRPDSFSALRYYDPARDYQPGLQHAGSKNGQPRTYQFPGALAASDAQELARKAGARNAATADRLSWRLAELDPSLKPGSLVTLPDVAGTWKVSSWEWRERGVELELVRFRIPQSAETNADPGTGWSPPDRLHGETVLRVFETPWDGVGSATARRTYAAASSRGGRWAGAALYAMQDEALLPTGQTIARRAVMGALTEPLPASNALRYQPSASMLVQLTDPEADLAVTDMAGLSQGNNRLMVGSEVIQFALAEPIGEGRWRLTGLLRGRGGTEIEALAGHDAGTPITLLDAGTLALEEETVAAAINGFAAMGLGDTEAVSAGLENEGASLRPPCPVHPEFKLLDDGSVSLSWIRRARGRWEWFDQVEQPMSEETESYLVGLGPVESPLAQWTSDVPFLTIDRTEIDTLRQGHSGSPMWVRQCGSFALSHPTHLGFLA